MNRHLGKIAIATTAIATLFTIDWSAPSGISISTDSAQARVGRPLTPVSVAGVARRKDRRAGYGYGAGVVGAGLAAGAVGAAAVAATSPYYGSQPYGYGYYAGGPNYQAAYYASDPNAAYASTDQGWAGGGYYAESPWGYYECQPGSSLYECQPYSHIGWYHY